MNPVREVKTRKLKLLIVDDERDHADLLKMRLESEGHTASAVYSGREALPAIARFKPDLAILDVNMPEKNGLALFLEMKGVLSPKMNGEAKPLYPVIITSGIKSQAVRELFESEGVWASLVKPLSSPLLLEKVDQAAKFFSNFGDPVKS